MGHFKQTSFDIILLNWQLGVNTSREIIERSGSDFSWDNGSPSIKWIITPGQQRHAGVEEVGGRVVAAHYEMALMRL